MIKSFHTAVTKRTLQGAINPSRCIIKTETAQAEYLVELGDRLDLKPPKPLKGDKVHALPYFREIIEPALITGDLDYIRNYGSKPRECGADSQPRRDQYRGLVPVAAAQRMPSAPQVVYPQSVYDRLRAVAETKALARARDQFVNFPLLIKERRETIGMIRDRGLQLARGVSKAQADALRRYGRSRKRDKPMVAKDIANAHLEMLFGWLPIIDEIEGFCDLLSTETSADFIARGRQASVEEVEGPLLSATRYGNLGFGSTTWPYQYQKRSKRKLSARCSLRYRINIGSARRLRQLGFNPIAATFDMIPLSFVLNFVSNTGQFLRGLDPLIGADFVTGSTTLYCEATESIEFSGAKMKITSGDVETSGQGVASRSGKRMDRIVLTHEPTGTLMFQNNMDLGKAAILASLALQRNIKPAKKLIAMRPFRYRGPRPRNLPDIRYRSGK